MPAKCLVRYQFLEFLVRIAKDKFLTTHTQDKIATAMEIILFENIKPNCKWADTQKWRVRKYFNEEVDTLYKIYYNLLQALYHQFSGELSFPGEDNFMSRKEFKSLC